MRSRDGEAEFEAFVRISGPSLLRTAILLTGDRGHAEDIVQNALERTALHWARLQGSPEAYARRAVVNGSRDRYRRRRARAAEVDPAVAREHGGPDVTAHIDLRDALSVALRELPHRQRSVLVCRYIFDLDERETAETLGIGVGTVKSSASRGLAALRRSAPSLGLAPLVVEPQR
jgi:RNA polymerase sigma-70 factor (sigma-E family)